ncbi:carotenoid biosynthesis protein [Nitrospirillum sp. BR 11164]|uniref:carotenoid biosynthesis protein n=1 Tax=Nitrospirillum sp. BR 11164 TaxID=3104324 RepID=UPI002B001C1A|nr:carotenoid biosynthesis protein [Nitrospirillum sp. BR 11164]MEA1650214.1 carotenoid biosynthesis protein [Nitrospirillum sp. BR 11164]
MRGIARAASETAIWGLFVILAYLILAFATHRWLPLPNVGNVGFTLVFVMFSLLHAGLMLGGRRLALFFGLSVVISYALEETGVRTGLVYGRYHYGDLLGAKLGHVPVLIPLAWFMMIYPAWVVALALLRGLDLRRPAGIAALALTAALVMTGWDMVMDPSMAAAGNWVWEDGGPYFGVPLRNYAGWVLTTFLVYLAYHAAAGDRGDVYRFDGVFAALPAVVYTLFSLEYLVPGRFPALAAVAVFAMVMPGMLALVRLAQPARIAS